MKNKTKQLLAFFAKKIIKKYQPQVIGITGSVGKTSSKEAIDLVLSCQRNVRSNFSNYNNEFGLPLTIIGKKSPKKNIFKWVGVFIFATKLLIFRDRKYPEILILEMGIDREGDMDYLLNIVRPDRAVLTNISHSHLEYFGNIEKIKKEKFKLLQHLNKGGVAIVNFNKDLVQEIKSELKRSSLSYGLDSDADVVARDINYFFPETRSESDFYGLSFKLDHGGSVIPINLPGVFSIPSVYAVLSALAVAISLDYNIIEILSCLQNYKNPVGRLNILPGIKNTTIIDDTYNSSPESSLVAIDLIAKMKKIKKAKKILVLGDMLELGSYSEVGHRLVGERIAKVDVDELILVGERSRDIGRGAIEGQFDKNSIFNFSQAKEAGVFLQNRMSEGDIVLVKGSQGARMEKVVKEVMADPMRATELLVRQEDEWLKK